MLLLRFAAPFACFPDGGAGAFRPTMRFAPPSAIYGLLLNVAGVEMRQVRSLPVLTMAVAAASRPGVSSLVRHFHLAPVGSANDAWEPFTKGTKTSISAGRREILCGLDGYCWVRASEGLEQRIVDGLAGEHARYGLPFLGDNSFLLDDLLLVDPSSQQVEWLVRGDSESEREKESLFLSLWVGRSKHCHTRSCEFHYREGRLDQPPEEAWVRLGPE